MLWIWLIGGVLFMLLPALYLLSVKGIRREQIAPLERAAYAHRGLHGDGRPENSLAAFRAAAENGFGAELDVHITADGTLAVIHDRSLQRTAGVNVDVTKLTAETLKTYRLEGTQETIPTLDEVLAVFDGKAPLIIELKADSGNHAALCDAVCRALDGYTGLYCLESFDPRCLLWLKKHRPAILRGQLSQNFFRSRDVHPLLRPILTSLSTNALTRPDFVAYRYDHRRSLPFAVSRYVWKTPAAAWTLTDNDALEVASTDGIMPIFEGFVPSRHDT